MILVVLNNQNTKKEVTKICNEPGSTYQYLFFRYSRPNGEQIDEFEIEDDTHQTIGRCRCLESHNPTEEAIATSGHLAVERGEELVVIQSDFGSGWTYVQGVHGVGFVPTKILYFV